MAPTPAEETRMVSKAFKVALDPTPSQERMLNSHAGGARFAYNWGIASVQSALDAREVERQRGEIPETPVPGHFDLCKAWTVWKNTAEWIDRRTGEVTTGVPWVGRNSSATYQAALRDAAKAWQDYFKSRTGQRAGRPLGKPRFKSKHRSAPAFQTHGGVRMDSATRVVLPALGAITVMSDDSRHPAMVRSRKHTPGQRHMGNRRRSRRLWQQIRAGQKLVERARAILAAAADGIDTEAALERLNTLADERARASALATATTQVDKAKDYLAKQTTPEKITKAEERLASARAKLVRAEAIIANRKDGWSERKLAETVKTGQLTPTQADDLAAALKLDEARHGELAQAALQPRITRATVSRGADGLWWVSLGCEVPEKVRTRPAWRQRARGAVGIDWGVRSTATLSKRVGGRRDLPNPAYLERAQAELRRAQQHLARCEEGSRRRERAKARVGLIHADVARLREQHQKRFATRVARRFAEVGVEGFDVQAMAAKGSKDLPKWLRRSRNRGLADVGIGTVRTRIQDKTHVSGSRLVKTESAEPTGRTCAMCGAVKAKPVPPWYEVFTCESCGHTVPRRLNTARLLEQLASGSGPPDGGSVESRGGDVSPAGPSGTGGRSPEKRAARSWSSGQDKAGTPGP